MIFPKDENIISTDLDESDLFNKACLIILQQQYRNYGAVYVVLWKEKVKDLFVQNKSQI